MLSLFLLQTDGSSISINSFSYDLLDYRRLVVVDRLLGQQQSRSVRFGFSMYGKQ